MYRTPLIPLVGVNAEYVRDGATGFHATQISQWVDRLGELIKDRQLRKRMGSAARADVRKFDVQVIGKQLLDLITSHLKHPRP
jgi:glycosyltransferase involved in cell wall biosynthesis